MKMYTHEESNMDTQNDGFGKGNSCSIMFF